MIQLICAGWLVGIALMGTHFSLLPQWSLVLPGFCFIFLIFFFYIFRKTQKPVLQSGMAALSFCLSLVMGYAYAQHAMHERLQFRELKAEPEDIIVYVRKLNEQGNQSIQQKVDVLNVASETVQWLSYLPVAQPFAENVQELQLGQYYRLSGTTRPAHSYATPGAFDQEKWYLQQNIMSGYSITAAQQLSEQDVYALGYSAYIRQQQSVLARLGLWAEQQRLQARHFIQQISVSHKGLLLALLTGDESFLDTELKEQFRRFGMMHLLAISGPHVLILAAMVCTALVRLTGRYRPEIYLKIPQPYFVIFPFLLCVLMYCAFVGFEIPALRTLLSCTVISMFILLKQRIRPLSALLYSAALLLLFDPFSILSAAFWLSYGACFVLLRIYQTLQQGAAPKMDTVENSRPQQLYSGLKLLVESQWKIFFALFPLMVIFFKQVAWITPLSNLFAIPWIGMVIVPLDVLAGLSLFIYEPLSSLLFHLNDYCIGLLLAVLGLMDRLFKPSMIPLALDLWQLLSLCLGLIILFMPKGIFPRLWAVLCFIPLLLSDPSRHAFELNILDVGQGQSIFIRDQQHELMVDTGGNQDESQFSIGRQILQPFLSVKGVSKLDTLVLTHLHQDHSGAYEHIKQEFNVDQVYSSEQVTVAEGSRFEFCRQGQQWQMGSNISLEVLSPRADQLAGAVNERNETSCVLYLTVKDAQQYRTFLLMGDAGWPTEFHILQHYPDLQVDVLVVGHHGSQYSSAYAFLEHYRPKLAIASAGFQNRYGHPSSMLAERLKALNIPFMTTVNDGTIRFHQQENKRVDVETYRHSVGWLTAPGRSGIPP